MRRGFAVVALTALVLLSGCSLLGGGGTPTPVAGTPTTTPTTTPTPSPTATPSPTPTTTPVPRPSGYGADGVTNATAARVGHTEALLARSNFTIAYAASVRSVNGTASISLLQGVDTGAGESDARTLADTVIATTGDRGRSSERRTRYYANGTEYIRLEDDDGNVSYGTVDRTLAPETFVGIQYVSPAVTNVSYDTGERFERNGTTFFRYRATGIDDPGALLSGRITEENVTGGNVTLVVDREGVVRSIDYRATVRRDGETLRYRVQFGVARLDGTIVQRPDWARRG